MSVNMIFHVGLLAPMDEARAFRNALLDATCVLEDGALVFDAIAGRIGDEDLTLREIEAILRLAGRALRSASDTSGTTLSTLYDHLSHEIARVEEDIPRVLEEEHQRAEAKEKEHVDADQ